MRTDVLIPEATTADDQSWPDLHRHPLSIDEIAAAGWGASWQPDDAPRPDWRAADDLCPPDREPLTASDAWSLWPILERFSP